MPMKQLERIALAAAIVFWAAPVTPAWADHDRPKSIEKRSEQPNENSNAQWLEDAKRGKERAAERRNAHGKHERAHRKHPHRGGRR
jgi:hypothetical protein